MFHLLTQGRMTKNVLSNEGGCVVVCDNIHKTYLLGIEGVPALRGVSLEVRELGADNLQHQRRWQEDPSQRPMLREVGRSG